VIVGSEFLSIIVKSHLFNLIRRFTFNKSIWTDQHAVPMQKTRVYDLCDDLSPYQAAWMCADANQMRSDMDIWQVSVISIDALTQSAWRGASWYASCCWRTTLSP
jgi:hypothetical protein